MAEIEEEEELQFGKASKSRGRKRRRTPREIVADKKKRSEDTMEGMKFKNERQVEAEALEYDHRGLRYINRKGLNF